jgi:hypothetical protein
MLQGVGACDGHVSATRLGDCNWVLVRSSGRTVPGQAGSWEKYQHTVNTSGKAGAQILHPPWEMIHLPGGDNAVGR